MMNTQTNEQIKIFKKTAFLLLSFAASSHSFAQTQQAQVPEPMPMKPEMTQYYEPQPKVFCKVSYF